MSSYKESLQNGENCKHGNYKLSQRLSSLLTARGDVSALARNIDVVEGTVRKWMKGTSEPKASDLVNIARALNINLHWLATGEGETQGTHQEESRRCTAPIDVMALTKALQLVELIQANASPEQKAKAAALAYDLLADPAQPLDVERIQRLLEPLLKGV